MTAADAFLEESRSLFATYKGLADRAIAQIEDKDFHHVLDGEANSIAVIMKHMAGNAISRWTDFLTTDGEKPDRNRDGEFVDDLTTREDILAYWERGWACVFAAVNPLTEDDLLKIVYIRGEAHSVLKAITRQISHYSYHVGQIVFLAKHFRSEEWKTLTIARNKSLSFKP